MALGVTLLLWILYRGVKQNPGAFSRENLTKSFMTMGILGLLLLMLVVFTIMVIK